MSNDVWRKLGAEDPYWGVLTEPRYHAERLTPESLDEFFRSGELHLSEVLSTIRRARPGFQPARALDFGCGVGRVTAAMSRELEAVVGVDVSDGMLEEARKNIAARGRPDRVTLAHQAEGKFDFAHSYIVLQHMPAKAGLAAMRAMVNNLNPGGVALLHFPFWRFVPWPAKVLNALRHHVPLLNPLINYYNGLPVRQPAMRGTCFDFNRVLLNARRDGGQFMHVEVEERGRYRLARLFVFT